MALLHYLLLTEKMIIFVILRVTAIHEKFQCK